MNDQALQTGGETPMLQSVDAMEAISRAEIDVQIATAKRYPRSISEFRTKVLDYVKSSPDVAAGCFYTLSRKEKSGGTKKIQGPSVRLAEICLSAWGNVRAGARPVAVLEDAVISQAVFYDIQNNVAVTMEVRRSIRTSSGARYGNDMINVTMQAASSIAFRNAVFKGIPAVFTREAYEAALAVAAGSIKSISESFAKAVEEFKKLGVSRDQLLKRLEVVDEKQVTKEMLIELMGVKTAIDTGDVTMVEEFGSGHKPGKPEVQKPQATGPAPAKDRVDPKTGEILESAAGTEGAKLPPTPAPAPEDMEKPINQAQVKALVDAAKRMKIEDDSLATICSRRGYGQFSEVLRKDYETIIEDMKQAAFGR